MHNLNVWVHLYGLFRWLVSKLIRASGHVVSHRCKRSICSLHVLVGLEGKLYVGIRREGI